jgi:hypothetical protein
MRAEKVSQALREAPKLKTITLRPQSTTIYLSIMAQNPSLQSIRMVVGPSVIMYPWKLDEIAGLEDTILRDPTLRSLVQTEYPEIIAG